MKISTEIASASRIIGAEKAVEYIAKAGFDCYDFSMFDMARYDWESGKVIENNSPLRLKDYLKYVRNIKKIAEDNGIKCNQSHAPFPSGVPDIDKWHKRAIECTAELGGKICVIHPNVYITAQENAEMYNGLLPFAKEHGVKIATENMFFWDLENQIGKPASCSSPESFVEHIKAVNDDYLVACVDIGHAEMAGVNGGAVNIIKALGSDVQALHIHDNNLRKDLHQIPFSMDINYEEVVKALKEIDYKGEFTLEADSYLGKFTEENCYDGIKDLYNSARKLADMYENL